MTEFNSNSVTMWEPSAAMMDERKHRPWIEVMSLRFADPGAFSARVEEICETSPPESYDILETVDHRTIERFSRSSL